MNVERYVWDEVRRIWAPRDGAPDFGYADYGDAESRLEKIISAAQDRSSYSAELSMAMTDWASTYHLSPYRANLLRPVRHLLTGSVLELGAGCGGIGRYIGETAARHVAVEGSAQRAGICSLRCADLNSTAVVCDTIEKLAIDEKFDAVTLIGVLEYARKYWTKSPGIDPIRELIKKAASFLTPEGVLLLAIENQLGLKYLAGANEDHLGAPWVGVEDRYPDCSALTFGKRELSDILSSCRLSHQRLFIPIPDYKLPVTIIDGIQAEKIGTDLSLLGALLSQGVIVDTNSPARPTFSIERAWPVVVRNRLVGDLANSFLFIASNSPRFLEALQEGAAAFHYGVNRKSWYAKEERFFLDEQSPRALSRPLFDVEAEGDTRFTVDWGDRNLKPGTPLSLKFLDVISEPNWDATGVVRWASPWFRELSAKADFERGDSGERRLPPSMIDATPANYAQTEDGAGDFFDLEWVDSSSVAFDFVVFRGLCSTFEKYRFAAKPSDPALLNHRELARRVMELLGIRCSESDIRRFLESEFDFRAAVTVMSPGATSAGLFASEFETVVPADEDPRSFGVLQRRGGVAPLGSARTADDYIQVERGLTKLRDSLLPGLAAGGAKRRSVTRALLTRLLCLILFLGCRCRDALGELRRRTMPSLREVLDIVRVLRSGFFDVRYYRSQVGADIRAPIAHYLREGFRSDLSPSPLFAPQWYRQNFMSEKERIMSPLSHYLRVGMREGANPHPLFYGDYYREQAGQYGLRPRSPLKNYLCFGRRLGISPCPLFDPQFYIERYPDITENKVDPFFHYATSGWREFRRPHPLFDPMYYLQQSRSECELMVDPLSDFLVFGGRRGLNPSADFSSLRYLDENRDVRASGINPLLHFLRYGSREGRAAFPVAPRWPNRSTGSQPPMSGSITPSTPGDWGGLVKRQLSADGAVDVIIPVYRGYAETLGCIWSVLAAKTDVRFRLIVIDDCSPDAELSRELRLLADRGLFLLRAHERNLGFVRSCNEGIELSHTNDVVLLNSDTTVYDYWLDRLVACAAQNPNIGTVTPLSNNATICSYPFLAQDFCGSLEISHGELDRLAAEVNGSESVDIPTGVGFCLFIKRCVLRAVGLLDADKFGHGYGEENDLCLRAAHHGWRNVLCTGVFVTHFGSTSFGDSRAERVKNALAVIDREYPFFEGAVRDVLWRDPMWESRFRLDLARVARSLGPTVFALVCHRRGGGTERHLRELAKRLEAEGASVLMIRPAQEGLSGIAIDFCGVVDGTTPTLENVSVETDTYIYDILCRLRVSHVHIHSVVDFSDAAVRQILRATERCGLKYDYTFHDYAAICPRIHLLDDSNRYCNEPDASGCNRCINSMPTAQRVRSITAWRGAHGTLLRGARSLFSPSKDTAERMKRYFPDLSITLRPHEVARGVERRLTASGDKRSREALRVGIFGALGLHKGVEVVYKCARDAHDRKLPIEFKIFGYHDKTFPLAELPNVCITGPYSEAELDTLIQQHPVDISFFASIWPETFSYTLSSALTNRIFPVAFDYGAIAERIRAVGWGQVVERGFIDRPAELNDLLLSVAKKVAAAPPFLEQRSSVVYRSYLADYYELARY